MRLRLLTWNVLGCRGCPLSGPGPVAFHDGSAALLTELAARLRHWRPDVVLVQEAPPEAQLHALAELAGMHAAFFPAQARSGPEYPFGFPGAVLSRYPLSAIADRAGAVRWPGDPRFERHWGSATVLLGETPLRVATTHLCGDWGGVDREATRLGEVAALLAADAFDVLAGDFNTQPIGLPVARLRDAGWRDAWSEGAGVGPGLTADARQPSCRIDYLWLNRTTPWQVRQVQVLDDLAAQVGGTDLLLSDHRPVLVELELAARDDA